MSTKTDIGRHINAVMEAMEWPDDAFVPIANEENRELMERLQQLLEDKNRKCQHHDKLKERVTWLQEHHRNAEVDVQQNLKLFDAHRRQSDTEHHMYKLAENDRLTMAKQKNDLMKEIEALEDQNRFVEKNLLQLNGKIDNIGVDMHWMKRALIEWTQAIEEGKETNELIEKYCRVDQKRADALEIRRKAVQTAIVQNKILLDNVCQQRDSVEQILDRTAHLYRQTHSERGQMVETWRGAVQAMKARDETIRETVAKITDARGVAARKSFELQQQTEFLDQQIANNKENNYAIERLNDKVAQTRFQLEQSNAAMQTLNNELIGTKRKMQHQTNQLQHIRQKNRQMTMEYEAKTKSIEEVKAIVMDLVEKLRKITDQRNSADDRLRHLDELIEYEEKSLNGVEVEMSRLGQMLFRSQQILQTWQNENKLIETQIRVLENTIKAITNNFSKQEKELARQMEIQYDIQFKILTTEVRIAKMQGKSLEINPESIETHDCLQQICMATRNKREHLRKQLTTAEEHEHRLTAQLAKDQVEQTQVSEKLKDRQMNCENTMKAIRQRREDLHERLVEHSLLKMRLHQMKSMFDKQMEKFFDLEQHKFQLQLAIDERLIDLRCQLDMLAMKRKHLCEERNQLRADLTERIGKIEVLRTRFQLANDLLGKNDDGSVISAIQLKIEAAQEKELLMQLGSKLNEKVINAERDIKALENTLILLNYSNDKYKRKMGQVHDEDECNELIQKLNDEYAKAMIQLKNFKVSLDRQLNAVQNLQAQHAHYERELDEILRIRLESNDALMKVHKEIFEQNSRVERAKREMHATKKTMVKKIADKEYVRIFEKYLMAKDLEERNSTALQQLGEMVDAVSGMGSVVTKHLYEKGIQMPVPSSVITASGQQAAGPSSIRNRSRTSMRSSGRDSDYSFNLNSQSQDGIISRVSERTFSSTSSVSSSIVTSAKSEKSRQSTVPAIVTLDFHIDGQSIRTEKPSNDSIIRRNRKK